MSAYLGLRSRAFSLAAVFAALLLSMSFASSATAAGGGKGASDKILTSGVEAFAKPGKGKGAKGGTDKGGKGGPTDGDDPTDPSPWICHWAGDRYLLIEPNDSSHTGGEGTGPGHDLHEYDRIIAPHGTCDFVPHPITNECPDGYEVSVDDVCVPIDDDECPSGQIANDAGVCVDPDPVTGCGDGEIRNDAGVCVDPDPVTGCADGEITNDAGVCVPQTNTGGGNNEGPGGGDNEVPGGGDNEGPGGKDNEGGAPTKPGKDDDGKPNQPGKDTDGKLGVKPIIKPGDKTPVVKGVDKEVPKPGTVVKPVGGNPPAQPQTGSDPNAGVPHAVDAGVGPAGKKNRPGANVLPNTGLEDHLGVLTAGGLTLMLIGGVLVAPRRRPVRVAR